MKLRFERLPYQWEATAAVCGVFAGQPKQPPAPLADKGKDGLEEVRFGNAAIKLSEPTLLENLRAVQRKHRLPESPALWRGKGQAAVPNLDVEMETGTGKTYVYTQTIHELHKRYGWSKFIVMVPSIAIREGVKASMAATADHFAAAYGVRARVEVYDSKRLSTITDFVADAQPRILIINTQAFAATGKDARRIRVALDACGSRVPLGLLAAARPILILDEPQRMEGPKTEAALKEFNPLFILRASATHKTQHDLVYRLDAVDAYKQKLVKKISVVGMSLRNLRGVSGYLYLAGVEARDVGGPAARLGMERRTASGAVARKMVRVGYGDDLFERSGRMPQYREGFVVKAVEATEGGGRIAFQNGVALEAGDVVGDETEAALHEVQLRETIRAHLRTEQSNFAKGIKTLSLVFIDHVVSYRDYAREDTKGADARLFERLYEEEVCDLLGDTFLPTAYRAYLAAIPATATHAGYFSIDKKSGHAIDTTEKAGEKDVDACDLILRDKESLLSLANDPRAQVRFIFSHSALREGWDNPNVFTMCLLRPSGSVINRRQEIGRGLRLCVAQDGARWAGGDPHDVNRLTVVTSESCKGFVEGLQKEFGETLRRALITETTFRGLEVRAGAGPFGLDAGQAKGIFHWLNNCGYLTADGELNDTYRADRRENIPQGGFPRALEAVRDQIMATLDRMAQGERVKIENGRDTGERQAPNPANRDSAAFRELWRRLHRKVTYRLEIDAERLIAACRAALTHDVLRACVPRLAVTVAQAEQDNGAPIAFRDGATRTHDLTPTLGRGVAYDLVGELASPARTGLTRRTVIAILRWLHPAAFGLYAANPERFITEVSRLINREKVRQVVETIAYGPARDAYDLDIFSTNGPVVLQSERTDERKLTKCLYPFIATDSNTERTFAKALDGAEEVAVFVKLPKAFAIPTPMGNYNPDWAIAFKKDAVRHLYFVAETKGSMRPEGLREDERQRIDCAKRCFKQLEADGVRYDVVNNLESLRDLLQMANNW